MGPMSPLLRNMISSRAIIAILLLLGATERVTWLALQTKPTYALREAPDLAISLARTGTYANAFPPDSGPSAHVLPIPPLIASGVYRALGVRTPAAETVLAGWAIGLSLLSFLLLYLIFGELGASRGSRLAALAIACLVPFNVQLETVYFKIWEGGLATAVALAFLLLVIRLDRTHSIGWRDIGVTAFCAALTFFIAPQLGLACYACAAILMARKLPPLRWPGAILAAAAALALFIIPWTIRNERALGEPVWLRSNFGLELSLGMNPAAVHARDQRQVFLDRMDEIHPSASPQALARLKAAGGEVPYSRALGERTKAWMAAHPAEVATLAVRHLMQMLFPPSWFWTVYGSESRATILKMLAMWSTMAMALLWIATSPWRRRASLVYPALMVLLPVLPYMITQPVLRYRYVIFGLTLFMACDITRRILARWPLARKSKRRAVAI